MWTRIAFLALLSVAAFAADDGWAKVKSVPSGAELRIMKMGARLPILVKMDSATDESLIVTTKTEQFSIPKEQIRRIEYRPSQAAGRLTRTTTSDNTPLNRDAARPAPGPARTPGPSGSGSSSVGYSAGKADFELLWRRPN